MTDNESQTPETAPAAAAAAATPAETAVPAEGAGASSQMTDTPQPVLPSEPDTLSPTSIAPVSAVTTAPVEPHELVLIDYQESTLHSLEEFGKLQGSARVQKEDLDAIVLNIAKTGQVWFVMEVFSSFSLFPLSFTSVSSYSYPWDLVKLYLAFRLETVCKTLLKSQHGFTLSFLATAQILNKFHKEKGFKPYNKDDTYQPRYDDLFAQLLDFPAFVSFFSFQTQHMCISFLFFPLSLSSHFSAPFTIQRLCEVIVRPEHYTQTNALLFGLEKMVSVSTVQKSLTPAEVERVNSTLTAAHQAAVAAAAAPERPAVPTKDTVIDVPARPAEDAETKMV